RRASSSPPPPSPSPSPTPSAWPSTTSPTSSPTAGTRLPGGLPDVLARTPARVRRGRASPGREGHVVAGPHRRGPAPSPGSPGAVHAGRPGRVPGAAGRGAEDGRSLVPVEEACGMTAPVQDELDLLATAWHPTAQESREAI